LDCILSVNKPVGWTSFDVVNWLKHRRKDVKFGHAGTLDPFAGGVLLILVGEATKRAAEFVNLEKEYVATVTLGIETDTSDISGKITAEQGIAQISVDDIEYTRKNFLGYIKQQPSAFSAVKIGGKRAYELARMKKDVNIKARRVLISRLDMNLVNNNELFLHVTCSKGTYIRTLAHDIARALGTVGFVRSLTRTRIGGFTLDASKGIHDLEMNLDQLLF
jgi:tRNA pseudouridine55 synthase